MPCNGGRKAYIQSTGCISNLLDGSAYQRLLGRHGFVIVDTCHEADLILVNTCAFSQQKEEEALRAIERVLARKRPHAEVVVCGCLPAIDPEGLAKIHHGATFGPRDLSKLGEILDSKITMFDAAINQISYL